MFPYACAKYIPAQAPYKLFEYAVNLVNYSLILPTLSQYASTQYCFVVRLADGSRHALWSGTNFPWYKNQTLFPGSAIEVWSVAGTPATVEIPQFTLATSGWVKCVGSADFIRRLSTITAKWVTMGNGYCSLSYYVYGRIPQFTIPANACV